jgi:hypothetical protein
MIPALELYLTITIRREPASRGRTTLPIVSHLALRQPIVGGVFLDQEGYGRSVADDSAPEKGVA